MGKDNTTVIYAPMSGDVVSLDEVPDPVFSGRVLGDGVANALQRRPVQVGSGVPQLQTKEDASGFGVIQGRSLPREIGQADKSVAARRDFLRGCRHGAVGIFTALGFFLGQIKE